MKRKLSILALCAFPLSGAAEGTGTTSQLLSTLVTAANSDDPIAVTQQAVEGYALTSLNNELGNYSASLLNDRLKYLSLSVGRDRDEVFLEGMSVYGLYENRNWFLFNQTSLINYDGRNTLNFGLGARHINDPETIIVGANAFYDFEFGSEHRRTGVGAEILTSLLQMRANYYIAATGERLVDGVYEEALSGNDLRLTYELPYFYQSDFYLLTSNWYDGRGYSTFSREYGLTAEIAPSLILELASTSDRGRADRFSGSLTYRFTLGSEPDRRVPRDGVFRFALEPVREMLYEPVQRENRIMTKSVSLGVVVSGY